MKLVYYAVNPTTIVIIFTPRHLNSATFRNGLLAVAGIGSNETDQYCIVYVSVRPDLRLRTRHCLAAILVFITMSYRIILGNKSVVFLPLLSFIQRTRRYCMRSQKYNKQPFRIFCNGLAASENTYFLRKHNVNISAASASCSEDVWS